MKNKFKILDSVMSLDNFNIIGRVEALLPPAQYSPTPALVIFFLHFQEDFTWDQKESNFKMKACIILLLWLNINYLILIIVFF